MATKGESLYTSTYAAKKCEMGNRKKPLLMTKRRKNESFEYYYILLELIKKDKKIMV